MASPKDDLNKTLVALTSSAFLLPAYQSAMADAPPEFTEIGMRYSKYKEDDLSAKKVFGGGGREWEFMLALIKLSEPKKQAKNS